MKKGFENMPIIRSKEHEQQDLELIILVNSERVIEERLLKITEFCEIR